MLSLICRECPGHFRRKYLLKTVQTLLVFLEHVLDELYLYHRGSDGYIVSGRNYSWVTATFRIKLIPPARILIICVHLISQWCHVLPHLLTLQYLPSRKSAFYTPAGFSWNSFLAHYSRSSGTSVVAVSPTPHSAALRAFESSR